jgi:predicted  nucleic acid-binding Zn-ribbon protein
MEQLTIAQKLEALIKLQSIDSKLSEILKVRGDLPEEVRDLEDELAGYETRLHKYDEEVLALEENIKN